MLRVTHSIFVNNLQMINTIFFYGDVPPEPQPNNKYDFFVDKTIMIYKIVINGIDNNM